MDQVNREHPSLDALQYFAGRPLFISQTGLAGLSLLEKRNAPPLEFQNAVVSNGVAVIPVQGCLVRKSSIWELFGGCTSYENLEAVADTVFNDPSVKGVILDIDSGGGEAAGLFETSEKLSRLAKASKKPFYAVANESALSAAYGLAVSADKIYVPRSAEVGSVGVVALHCDESKQDAMLGLKYTYIYSGDHKVDGNPHEPLEGDAKERLQRDVDEMRELFAGLVASRRGMTLESVMGTEAGVFRGEKAVEVGLADVVGNLESAVSDMQAVFSPVITGGVSAQKDMGVILMAEENKGALELEEKKKLEEAKCIENGDDGEEKVRKAEAEGARKMAELFQIEKLASRLGVKISAEEAFKKGVSADALGRQVLEMLAATDEGIETFSMVDPETKTAKSTAGDKLVEFCKNNYK